MRRNKSLFACFLFLVILFALPAVVSAATYYIDWVNGSDTNGGTSKVSPWKRHPYMKGFTGNYAHQAGDRFIFKGGVTWPSDVFQMRITQGGSSPSNVDYYGVDKNWYAGGSWARPLFDFQYKQVGGSNDGILVEGNYITIDDIEFAHHTVPNAWPPGITIRTTGNYVTIQNCYVHDWTTVDPASDTGFGGGIVASGTGTAIKNCVFNQAGQSAKTGQALSVSGVEVSGNAIYQVSNALLGYGNIHDNHIYNVVKATNPAAHENALLIFKQSTIYNNLIHDVSSGSSGIYIAEGFGGAGPIGVSVIYNNVMYNLGNQHPITIDGSGVATPGAEGAKIFNNTFEHPELIRIQNYSAGGCLGTLDVRNNHFISDDPDAIRYDGCTVGQTVSNNVLMTKAAAASGGYSTANNYAPPGASGGTIDKGVSLSGTFTSDIRGAARPQGAAWDVGAYEFGGTGGGGGGGTSWYVDNAATGANNGTSWTNAWRSFSAINWNSIQPGDTVYISGGNAGGSKTYSGTLTVPKSGAPGRPITIKPGAGEPNPNSAHSGLVIIDGGGNGPTLSAGGNYITFDGNDGSGNRKIKVIGRKAGSDMSYGSYNTYRYLWTDNNLRVNNVGLNIDGPASGATGNVIEYNLIQNAYGKGIFLRTANTGNPTDNIVRYNQVEIAQEDGMAFRGAISIYGNWVRKVGPAFDETHPDGVQPLGGSNIRLYNNLFTGFTAGINIDAFATDMRDVWIYNNVLYNIPGEGDPPERMWGGIAFELEGQNIGNIYVLNNTTGEGYNLRVGGSARVDGPFVSKNNVFDNGPNLLNTPAQDVWDWFTTKNTPNGGVDYNHYTKTSSSWLFGYWDQAYTTFEAWKSVTGQDSHSRIGDAKFFSQSAFKLWPVAGSPLIDAGADLSSYCTADKAGPDLCKGIAPNATWPNPALVTRTGAWDIGAYEYGSSGGGGGSTPIYGQCGTILNACASGTLNDTTDSSTEYLWQCVGSNGGGTASCNLPRTTIVNQPPTVSITSPRIGQNFPTATAAVTVNVSALDVDGTARVDFYDGNVLYGRDDDASCENGGTSCSYPASFSFTFGDLTAGAGGAAVSHTLRAVAYDSQGASASAAVIITVGTLMGSGSKSANGGSSDVPPCTPPTVDLKNDLKNVSTPCPVLSVSVSPIAANAPVTIGLTVQPHQYVWNTIFVTDISNPKIKKWIPKTIPSCGTDGWCTSSDGTGHTLTLSPTALSALGGVGTHYVASWDWTWNGECWLGPGTTSCDTPGKWRVQKFEVE